MTRTGPLRILYSFPHPVGAPGIGTTAASQVVSLAEQGAQVTLVCTSLHAPVPASVTVRETLRVAGRRIPHRAFGTADRALAYHDWRVARLLRRAGRDVDGRPSPQFHVVHTWPQSALKTLEAARERGCLSSREVPNTHTANAYAEAEAESAVVGVELGRRHSHRPDPGRLALEDEEYARADLLLVPSEHVEQTFLDRGIPAARLRRHQYGYDAHRFHPRGRLEWPDRPFTAVFVGRAEPRKGLHYALQAWLAAGPPADGRFLVAGGFVPGYREYVDQWLRHPSIELLGFVDDVPSLLRRSDVLLLPSVEEGSALVTYEAQASGCIPLVSAATGAHLPASLAGHVHAPRDVDALTTQLRGLAGDAAQRARLRQDVVDWSAGLTWQAAARRMVEIYEQELSTRTR